MEYEDNEGMDENYLTAEQAKEWRDRIVNNKEHTYWDDKAPMRERDLAIAFVQRLDMIIAKGGGSIEGYVDELDAETKERQKAIVGYDPDAPRSSSNEILPNQSLRQPDTSPDSIGYGEQERKSASGERIEDA